MFSPYDCSPDFSCFPSLSFSVCSIISGTQPIQSPEMITVNSAKKVEDRNYDRLKHHGAGKKRFFFKRNKLEERNQKEGFCD